MQNDCYDWLNKILLFGNSRINHFYQGPQWKRFKVQTFPHITFFKEMIELNISLVPDRLHGNQDFLKYFLIAHHWIFNCFTTVERPLSPGAKQPCGHLHDHYQMIHHSMTLPKEDFDNEADAHQELEDNIPQISHGRSAIPPDRVAEILYQFTYQNQPSTSRGRFIDFANSKLYTDRTQEASHLLCPRQCSMFIQCFPT